MKRTLLYFLVFLCVSSVCAKERTFEQKKAIAARLLGKDNVRLYTRASESDVMELKEMSELTVMGYEKGGFVIVSNDDRNNPYIGYSNNLIDMKSPEFNWYLTMANTALKETSTYKAISTKAPIEPLLETTWGQDTPYNDLCPSERDNANNKYPTGCVATAMAQVMYYHKYPEKGIGKVIYSFQDRILEADFNNTTYLWVNMLPSYTKGNYTDESALAVSTLMYHCGASIKMQYNTGGSGAYTYNAATALRQNFGYHKNLQIHYRDYYTTKEWMNLIYNELQAGRPLIYSGTDERNGGHCFVLDGYDAEDFVHVNWGWDGKNDGYYDITLLNPASYQFSLQQTVLCGVDKPTADVEYEPEVVTDGNFKVTKLGSKRILISDDKYANLSDLSFTGTLAYILEGNGQQHVLLSQENTEIYNMYYLTKPSTHTCTLPSDLKDGTYRVYPAVKEVRKDAWFPVHFVEGSNNSYMVEISNGTIKSTPEPVTDTDWHETTGIFPILSTSSSTSPYTYIYNMQGQEVYRENTSDFNIDNVPVHGILIMKQGNKTQKIIK